MGERDWEAEGERARSASVVLAADTRSAQRSVPAHLDGSAQPGGGTSLPAGNQHRGAVVRDLTAVSLFNNFKSVRNGEKKQVMENTERRPRASDRCLCPARDLTPTR